MATRRLTARSVATARTDRVQEDFRDELVNGLVLRVFATGRKTWGLLYRTTEGRRRWYRIGRFPGVDLEAARSKAKKLIGRIADGEDPQAERDAARKPVRQPTVEELAREFLERYSRRRKRPRGHLEDVDQMERYVLPAWAERKAAEIARRDVKRLLEDLASGKISKRGVPTTTAPRLLRALLSKMFAWAVEEEILPANPAAGVPLPVQSEPRERVLSEEEIRILASELERLDDDSPISAAAFRALLLTAQRPGEVLGMRWAEIAGEWWTIPGGRTKNGKSHRAPLSPQALAALAAVEPLTGASEFVFDSPYRPGSPIRTLKTAVHTIRRRAEMERWTPHDLRRTAATHMTSMGIPRLVVERILGHSDRSIAAVYDRSSYDREKRRALIAWGRRVEAIAAGRNGGAVVEVFPQR